ncbi:MAG TPA: hypothetical protein VGY58_12185 [Gemmataceae bacterium]|jgi:hypothetical protein|nr:hypothetical protein [Gemmataceae bacterium]
MIAISRALARLLLTVLRKSLADQEARRDWPSLLCRADGGGLSIYAQAGQVGVHYHEPGRPPPGTLAFRASMLEIIGGRGSDGPVTLEPIGADRGRARWQDGAIPRVHEFETLEPSKVPKCPKLPSSWTPLPAEFLPAFDEAAQTASKDSYKFALACIQLRGKAGQIVATDSKQALIQAGFRFPWSDDVLVPRIRAFGLRELATESQLRVARTDKTVYIQTGPWTFLLGIDTDGKPPPVHAVIPKPSAVTCKAQFDPQDAVFLVQALPKLPGRKDDNAPVTLDLGRSVAVRAQAQEGGTVTEVELAQSTAQGTPQRLCLNRIYLERALQLRLLELHVVDPGKPVVFRDKHCLYLTMTLGPDFALAASPDAIRISSTSESSASKSETVSDSQPLTLKRTTTMPARHPNHHASQDNPGNGSVPGSPDNGSADSGRGPNILELLAEAEQLRSVLQDASTRLSRLINGLKQQRRQGRAMQAAMQSLKQLQLGD